MLLRKTAALLGVTLGCVLAAAPATAQDRYPNRPINFIVPYQAGGLGDTIARAVGKGLSDRLGQAVIILNRPGASQAIGADAAARAEPDGYTLFMGTQSGLILNTLARKSLPYDPIKSFAPISTLFVTPLFLVAHPSVGVKNIDELVAKARQEPGKLAFASIGQGTSQHLAAERFKLATGADLLHVPYKGSADAIANLISGEVQLMFEGGMSALPHVRDGKLVALATTSTHRNPDILPDLPTVAESLPDYHVETWFGLVAPAGTPPAIIEQLNREVAEVLKTPDVINIAKTTGSEVAPSSPQEMAERMQTELKEYGEAMRQAGIEPQ